MAKEVKVQIKDIENDHLIFELSENAEKGDWFDLNKVNTFNVLSVEKALEPFKKQIIDKWKEEESKKIHDNAVNEFKASGDYKKLENEITALQTKLKNEKDSAFKEFIQSDDYKKIIEENKQLLAKNKVLEEDKNNTIDKFKNGTDYTNLKNNLESSKLENKDLQAKVNKLEDDEQHLKNEYELKLANQMLTERPKIVEDVFQNDPRVNELRKLINEKDKELEFLRFTQHNTKLVGEALEKHLRGEYDKTLGNALRDNASFEKVTKDIDDKKPDFVFSVYKLNPELTSNDREYRTLIGKVIIEAKNESYVSHEENRKKNVDHLKKLEKDCENFGGKFGILVTNLERDQAIDIRIAPFPYENIFIVRPAWLIPLLSLLYFIIKKESEVNQALNQYMNLNWDANTLDELKQEFNNFKADILKKTIDQIDKKFKTIDDDAQTIKDKADDIIQAKNYILKNYFDDIKDKLTRVSIDSLLKKVGKSFKKLDTEELSKPTDSDLEAKDDLESNQ